MATARPTAAPPTGSRTSGWARVCAGLCVLGLATTAAAAPVHAVPATPAEGGDRLCVAGHNVNLRATPSTRGKVADRLGLGTTVMVRAVVPGGAQRIGSRTDWWYQVAVLDDTGEAVGKGYMFGGTLTPACILADLDGDGDTERATVSVNPQGTPLVRIIEQSAATEATASLPITRAGSVPLTSARVDLIPESEAGFAMVRVEVFGDSAAARAEGRVFYVSYQASRSGVQGAPTLALSHPADGQSGNTSWTTRMAFDGATGEARLTTVTTRADGTTEESERRYKSASSSFVDVTNRR